MSRKRQSTFFPSTKRQRVVIDLTDDEDIPTLDNPICPITQEPIKEFGVTCVGSVYERKAIEQWLKDNTKDPLTGMELPTKVVKTVQDRTVLQSVKDDFVALTRLWNNGLWFKINSEEVYRKTKDRKVSFSDSPTDDVTGVDYTHKNLSNSVIRNKQFKSSSFIRSDLSDTKFFECDFSRCNFIGASLDGAVFVDCRFIGEEVSFYKASCNHTSFVNCSFEELNSWKEVREVSGIRRVLSDRLADVSTLVVR